MLIELCMQLVFLNKKIKKKLCNWWFGCGGRIGWLHYLLCFVFEEKKD